jgi:ketosteroid isomerase-like protein
MTASAFPGSSICRDDQNEQETSMQSDEREIRQLVTTWLDATRAGDIETVLSLMAEDAVFLIPGQPVMRKADFAAAARAGRPGTGP